MRSEIERERERELNLYERLCREERVWYSIYIEVRDRHKQEPDNTYLVN